MGLTRGMTLADAQARTPDLKTVVHRPNADQALLAQVLDDFGRFTPMAAIDGDDALILDVTGCTHLFGDEAGLIHAVEARSGRIGLAVRTALAGTPKPHEPWCGSVAAVRSRPVRIGWCCAHCRSRRWNWVTRIIRP